jgi:hypothetical protein
VESCEKERWMNKTAELAYWINQRYLMKMRKEGRERGAQWQWKYGYHDDPHMGLVRYCNVHREDDKVTKWLAQHWRRKHHAVWEIVLARMINYIPSLQQILTGWEQWPEAGSLQRAKTDLVIERGLGRKIFTSAYTISTCGQSMDKIDYVINVVCLAMQADLDGFWDRISEPRNLAQAHEDISSIKGLGSFLAAQVVADLKNTAGHLLQKAPDWWTWAAPGPGSLKGLSEYFGKPITPGQFTHFINHCWTEVKPHINAEVPPLHMQDFQNCLCEFSKYERVKKGGHVRNKYRPGQD